MNLGQIVKTLEWRYPVVDFLRKDGGACHYRQKRLSKGRIATVPRVIFQARGEIFTAEYAYPEIFTKGPDIKIQSVRNRSMSF